MNAQIYKGLSDAKQIVAIRPNVSVYENFPNIDYRHNIILANGRKVESGYIVHTGDLIVVRSVPSSTAVAVITIIIAVGAAIYGGIKSYQAKKAAQKAQKEIDDLKDKLSDGVTNLPYIRGSSNSVATGKTQPYFIGQRLIVPYLMNSGGKYKGYSVIEGAGGKTQFYIAVLEGGFNSQVIRNLYCEDVSLKNWGTSLKTPQEGFYYFDETSPFNEDESVIEIAQDGKPFDTEAFNKKIVQQTPNATLEKADSDSYEDLQYTLSNYSQAADICILFNGLCAYTSKGKKITRGVTVIPEYSLDSGTKWTAFTFKQCRSAVSETIDKTQTCYFTCTASEWWNAANETDFINSRFSDWSKGTPDVFTPVETELDSYKITGLETDITEYTGDDDTITVMFDVIETVANPDYSTADVESNIFSDCTLKQLRYNAHVDFDYAEVKDLTEPILVRVRCTTDAYDGSAYDGVTVLWVQSTIYNPDDSAAANAFVTEKIVSDKAAALSTLIGLKIKSTASNEDKLEKINMVSAGVARTWNGTSWSTEKTATSNPAAWWLEVATSKTHGPSQCDDSEIDLDSFGEWYEYCKQNEININAVLTSGDTKQNVLNSIADIGNGAAYTNIYGKIAVAYDGPKENAMAVLNEQNLIDFSYEKDISKRTDGIDITFYNEDEDYAEDTYRVYRADADKTATDNNIRELTINNITNYKQIVKYARRLMAVDELRPQTVTAKVGKEGIYYTPLAKILIQHPSIKTGLGAAEIKQVVYNADETRITGVTLYEPIEYDSTNADGFGVIMQCVGSDYCAPLSKSYSSAADGRVTEIVFDSPIAADASVVPHTGDILSYGYLNSGAFDTITSPFLISGIEPNDDGYTLTLVDYNEAVYDSGTIPAYTPNITQHCTSSAQTAPSSPAVTPENLESAVSSIVEGDESYIPDTPKSLTAAASQDSISIKWTINTEGDNALANNIASSTVYIRKGASAEFVEYAGDISGYTYSFARSADGYPEASDLLNWQIKVKVKNAYGIESETTAAVAVNTTSYGTWTVQAPSVSTRVSGRAISLFLSQPARSDGRELYGNTKYRVAIKRTSATADTQYYAPAVSADYTASEDNYKDTANTDGYVYAQELYQQTLPLLGQNATEPLPVDTSYSYSITAENEKGTSSGSTEVSVIALATSAKDIVAAAITTNKLADGCVTVDKLHANCITAEKMASTDLATMNLTLGNLRGNSVEAEDGDNYWTGLDTDTPEFRIGNSKALEESGDESAEYLHYKNGSLSMKLANFIVTAVASIIKGLFRVKATGATDANSFLVVNPTTSADSTTNTPAQTIKTTGNIQAGGNVKGETGTITGALTAGSAQVGGDVTIGGKLLKTIAASTLGELLRATMADNDFFRIACFGSYNDGAVELATADDGTEPIFVRQYSGVFSSVVHEAVLLDSSGGTSFPVSVTAPAQIATSLLRCPIDVSSTTSGATWLDSD